MESQWQFNFNITFGEDIEVTAFAQVCTSISDEWLSSLSGWFELCKIMLTAQASESLGCCPYASSPLSHTLVIMAPKDLRTSSHSFSFLMFSISTSRSLVFCPSRRPHFQPVCTHISVISRTFIYVDSYIITKPFNMCSSCLYNLMQMA